MNRRVFAAFFLLLSISAIPRATTNVITSRGEDRENLSITIYNDDTALISEARKIDFKKGINQLTFEDVSAKMDARSAILSGGNDTNLKLIEQNFDYDLLSPSSLLSKAVGSEIKIASANPVTGKKGYEKAILLSNNQTPILKYKDRIEVGSIDQFSFTGIPKDLKERPTLSMLIDSENNAEISTKLTYLSSGFSWNADYNAILNDDETKLNLSALITLINNSGSTFRNAKLKLLAGNINYSINPLSRAYNKLATQSTSYIADAEYVAQEENLSDYHLYTLPFKTTLKNRQTKQVNLFSADQVRVSKEYRLVLNAQYSNTNSNDFTNAAIFYLIKNKDNNALGRAFPAGIFRLYKNNQQNEAIFIGEDSIKHTPKDKTIEIRAGEAFDITANKAMKKENLTKNSYQTKVTVQFQNASNEPVSVNYFSNNIPGDWRITSATIPSSRYNDKTAQWTIPIAANSKTELIYSMLIIQK